MILIIMMIMMIRKNPYGFHCCAQKYVWASNFEASLLSNQPNLIPWYSFYMCMWPGNHSIVWDGTY